jgi:hypothetical protein
VVVVGTQAYWAAGGASCSTGNLRTAPSNGSAPASTLLTNTWPRDPVLYDAPTNNLYWIDTCPSAIEKLSLDGGTPTRIAAFSGSSPQICPTYVALDGTDAYYLSTCGGPNGNSLQVWKAPK